jgi:hypothetical protein
MECLAGAVFHLGTNARMLGKGHKLGFRSQSLQAAQELQDTRSDLQAIGVEMPAHFAEARSRLLHDVRFAGALELE